MKIRKNDNVLVIAGKDKGKTGKVRYAYPRKQEVLIEGVNMVKKHSRATGQVRQAGIIEREAPMHVSNVLLVCNKCNHPTRIGVRMLEEGKKSRICHRCKEEID